MLYQNKQVQNDFWLFSRGYNKGTFYEKHGAKPIEEYKADFLKPMHFEDKWLPLSEVNPDDIVEYYHPEYDQTFNLVIDYKGTTDTLDQAGTDILIDRYYRQLWAGKLEAQSRGHKIDGIDYKSWSN